MEYRLIVGYLKSDPDGPYPVFNTMDKWQQQKGTKLDVLARICRHYLSADDVPDVYFENGAPVFPPCVPVPGEISRNCRVIIFANFSSMAGLMQNVSIMFS